MTSNTSNLELIEELLEKSNLTKDLLDFELIKQTDPVSDKTISINSSSINHPLVNPPFDSLLSLAIKDQNLNYTLGDQLAKYFLSYSFIADYHMPTLTRPPKTEQYFFKDEIHIPCEEIDEIGKSTSLFNEEFYNTYGCQYYSPYALVDLTSYKDQIIALPFKKNNTDEITNIPINFIHNIFGHIGIGIGKSTEEAKTRALYECLIQYIKMQVLTNNFSLPQIKEEDLPKVCIVNLKQINTQLEQIFGSKIHLNFYDASLGGKYPVICCAIFSQDPSCSGFSLGYGANFDLNIALLEALCDALKPLKVDLVHKSFDPNGFALKLCYEINKVLATQNVEDLIFKNKGLFPTDVFKDQKDFPLSLIMRSYEPKEEFDALVELIEKQNKNIYFYIYNEEAHLVRAIIPNFSEARDPSLFEENNLNTGLIYYSFFENLPKADDELIGEFLESLKENEISDLTTLEQLLKIPRLSGANTKILRTNIAWIKALIAIKQRDFEAALYWLKYDLDETIDHKFHEEIEIISLLIMILEIECSGEEYWFEYTDVFNAQYDQEIVDYCTHLFTDPFSTFYNELQEYFERDYYADLLYVFINVQIANLSYQTF